MYEPSRDSEVVGLLRYVDQQLSAIRASVHGLTEQQARETPCRSALSIAGMIKHTAQGMRGVTANLRDGMAADPLTEHDFAQYLAGSVLADDESTLAPTIWQPSPPATRPARTSHRLRPGRASTTLGRSTLVTTWCIRLKRWRGTQVTPTSSVSNSTAARCPPW